MKNHHRTEFLDSVETTDSVDLACSQANGFGRPLNFGLMIASQLLWFCLGGIFVPALQLPVWPIEQEIARSVEGSV